MGFVTFTRIRPLALFLMLMTVGVVQLWAFSSGGPEKPRLVVRVVVEQMRYEMLLRYWDRFGADGFKKLIDGGVVCRNTRIGYAQPDRSSGFATLATGSYPSMHGIVGDGWYDRLSSQEKLATGHPAYQGVGGEQDNGHYAPHNLMTSTTGDELKMIDPHAKVFSLGMHPASAVLGAGKMADGAFWMDDPTANWMTNTYYMDSLPQWTGAFNAKNLEDIYMERRWQLVLPDSTYRASTADGDESEEGFMLLYRNEFPYNLKTLRRKARGYKYLKFTPFGNTYTKDFALALIANEKLGEDEHTDLINIAFSAPAYVNELFGPRSVEMEDLYIRLDREIGHLLTFLEERFSKDRVLVVMTSDRGAADSYEYRSRQRLAASEFHPSQGLTLLRSYLNVVYEPADWVTNYSHRQIYLDHGLIDQKGYEINDFQETVARFMVKKSGVSYAVKSSTIQNSSYSEGMMKMVQNNFHPARSGDIFLVLAPGIVEMPNRSGSIYSYDTHIPMIWWGNGFPEGTINNEVNLRDVAPTISYLLNIPYPDASFGKPIIPLIEQERIGFQR